MNILYTCDNNYIWIMGISIISLFENNRELDVLDIYLLGDQISSDNKKILFDLADKYNRSLYIIDVPRLDIPEILVSKRWPLSAFTRLFAGQLLPCALDKILYLDCDTVILESIEELEKYDMNNFLFCGVKDCIGSTYKKNIGLCSDSKYINAGVLLINLKKLQQVNVSKRLEYYLQKYTAYISYADQDILNGAFYKDIGELKPQYDVMTISKVYTYGEILVLRNPTNYYERNKLEEAIKHPIIIHYTTNMLTVRPWYKNTNHPFTREFQKYLMVSPWANKELSTFQFTSKEAKIIRIIQYLPKCVANRILGCIHSELKPLYIKLKAKLKKI